nr:MAG TPA: hypothetical protein [Caudoviricetes sp.]
MALFGGPFYPWLSEGAGAAKPPQLYNTATGPAGCLPAVSGS